MRMVQLEDMQVAHYHMEREEWGDETDNTSNWNLVKEYAAFSHREYCEFILALVEGHIQDYERAGFSKKLIGILTEAAEAGFKYVCLYS